jgi:hypothetical protein
MFLKGPRSFENECQTDKTAEKKKWQGVKTLIKKLIQMEAQIIAINNRYLGCSTSQDDSPVKVVYFFAKNGLPSIDMVSSLSSFIN